MPFAIREVPHHWCGFQESGMTSRPPNGCCSCTSREPKTAIMMHARPTASGSVPPRSSTVTASGVSCTIACTPKHSGVPVVNCSASTSSPTRRHESTGNGWLSTIDGLSVNPLNGSAEAIGAKAKDCAHREGKQ